MIANDFDCRAVRNTIYSSARKFVIFSYDTSHGLLLLRSGKTVACDPPGTGSSPRAVRLHLQDRHGSCGRRAHRRDLGHFEIRPTQAMPESEFLELLGQVKLGPR